MPARPAILRTDSHHRDRGPRLKEFVDLGRFEGTCMMGLQGPRSLCWTQFSLILHGPCFSGFSCSVLGLPSWSSLRPAPMRPAMFSDRRQPFQYFSARGLVFYDLALRCSGRNPGRAQGLPSCSTAEEGSINFPARALFLLSVSRLTSNCRPGRAQGPL
jgi:hypothetical protein